MTTNCARNSFHFVAFFLLLLSSFPAQAQRAGFTYQAVAMDASKSQAFGKDSRGEILTDTDLSVRFTLLEGSDHGNVAYEEEHETTTDIFGIFRLVVGRGKIIYGSDLESLKWGEETYFLKVEIDLGDGFIEMGIEELFGSPYSLNRTQLSLDGNSLGVSGGNTVTLSDNDALNEHNQDFLLNGTHITIKDAGGSRSVDLAGLLALKPEISEAEIDAMVSNNGYLTAEVDGSTTNEIQDLHLSGHVLTITQKENPTEIDLAQYLDASNLTEADVDQYVSNNGYLTSENQDISTSVVAGNIAISGGSSININVNDADANPANEIQDLSLSNNLLTVTNNTSATPISLVPYLDAAFRTTNFVTSNAPGNYTSDDFVFGSAHLEDDGDTNHYNRFMFNKSLGAFRAGRASTDAWNLGNLGTNSTAFGLNSVASGANSFAAGNIVSAQGESSVAMGHEAFATGNYSFAFGVEAYAIGARSLAMGNNTFTEGMDGIALGNNAQTAGISAASIGYYNSAHADYSVALGAGHDTFSYGETALGLYSSTTGAIATSNSFSPDERLFTVGNGTSTTSRSNALVMLKNGNTSLFGNLTIDADNISGAGGSYTLPAQRGTNGQVMITDGSGNVSWSSIDASASNEIQDLNLVNNTLTVTNNPAATNINLTPYLDAAFKTTNHITSNSPGDYASDDFVFGSAQLNNNMSVATDDARMFFDKSKGAFRVGIDAGTTFFFGNGSSFVSGVDDWADNQVGTGSVGMGLDPVASGNYSVALGNKTKATNTGAFAAGSNSIAGGFSSVAIGDQSFANGNSSLALGAHFATADGVNSIAMGETSHAVGESSIATGEESNSSGEGAISVGNAGTQSTGFRSVSIGIGSIASGDASMAMGTQAQAIGTASLSWGYHNIATGNYSSASGASNQLFGEYSQSLGYNNLARSFGETVTGIHCSDQNPPFSGTQWNSNDRLFVIGNGQSTGSRSDALVMLKNGTTRLHGLLTIDADNVSGAGGSYTLPGQRGVNGQVMVTDGSGVLSWSTLPTPTITTTAGVSSNANGNYNSDDFVFGSPTLNYSGLFSQSARMFFDKSSGAFRAGLANGGQWDSFSVGSASAAFGIRTIASGVTSFAVGYEGQATGNYSVSIGDGLASGEYSRSLGKSTQATGNYSVAMGFGGLASGTYSTTLGGGSTASGVGSFAAGLNCVALSYGEIVLGVNATQSSPASAIAFSPGDRLFVIGNGTGSGGAVSDALVMLKNGNTTLNGQLTIDADNVSGTGEPYTLPGQDGNTSTFIVTDGNGNTSWTNQVSDLTVTNTFTNLSDKRLKHDFKPLIGSAARLQKLNAFNYRWNSISKQDTVALQTGLIAQEVEKIFPELVKTDNEGFKSINYIGLIPHLIEAVKELKRENDRLGFENMSLKKAAAKNESIEARLQTLEKLVQQMTSSAEKK